MVPTPMVMAYTGTSSRRSKNRALSSMVCLDSVLSRVRELSELPGSLKAMWPSAPIPRICRSIPPRDVHVLEEVLVHEVVVALRVTHRQPHVFVEVERRHPGEVEPLLLMQP